MKSPLLKSVLVIVLFSVLAVSARAVDLSTLTPVSPIPTNGTFFPIKATNAWAPMPVDPFPTLDLYTDGTNYYYDDRDVDISDYSQSQSGVLVNGVASPDDSGPGLPPGFTPGPGSVALAQPFTPPADGYSPCETDTNFWLQISVASGVADITITNALPDLVYVLLEKQNLSQTNWTAIQTLTNGAGYSVSTTVTIGTNDTSFFEARLASYDQPPVITEPPTGIITNLGSSVTLTVSATGLAPLSYQWYFDGAALANGGQFSGVTTNHLSITSTTTSNAGTYTVVVSNVLCEAQASCVLQFPWTNYLGGAFDASPTLAPDGTIYLANENNEFYALNALNGATLWQTNMATNGSYIPLTSSAALSPDGADVYVGTKDGILIDFYTATHQIHWTNAISGSELGTVLASTPSVGADGEIYIGAYATSLPAIVAVNPAGSIDWAFTNFVPLTIDFEDFNSSVSIAPDCSLYFLPRGGQIYALNHDGSLKWFLPVYSAGNPNSAPAIGPDGTIYFGTSDDYIYALSPLGTILWDIDLAPYAQFSIPQPISSTPALAPDGTLYVSSTDENLYAITNGQIKWIFTEPYGNPFVSSPSVAADGAIYVGSGGIFSGYTTGDIYSLTPDGDTNWSFNAGAPVASSPVIGPNGAVYIATANGYVYCLAGSPPAASSWPMFRQNSQNTGAAPNQGCSGAGGVTFFPSNPGLNGSLNGFAISGPPNATGNIYVSTNFSSWSYLTNFQMQVSGSPTGWVTFTDPTPGITNANRFYQIRSDDFCSDIIGWVNLPLAQGNNLIANPFYGVTDPLLTPNVPQNSLSQWQTLLADVNSSVPNGLNVVKWDDAGFKTNVFDGNNDLWVPNGDATILPGESAIFVAATATDVAFAGRIPRGTLVNPIDARTNYLSSILPVAGHIQTVLGFQPSTGDNVYLYPGGSNSPSIYTSGGGTNWSPSEPYLQVGQGFVLITTNTANNWQTNFSICAGE